MRTIVEVNLLRALHSDLTTESVVTLLITQNRGKLALIRFKHPSVAVVWLTVGSLSLVRGSLQSGGGRSHSIRGTLTAVLRLIKEV